MKYSIDYRKKAKEYKGRTAFERDYDRIIFSNPFRRLSRKTQVHPLSENDHIHNRMSHSLEVASVGRSLGLKVGKFLHQKDKKIKPYDIAYVVQTACLIHDIGNTPFGHTGEDVIKEWFNKEENKKFTEQLSKEELLDFQNLDGNAQSFRTVSSLEKMNLTYGVLASIVKYPYFSTECKSRDKQKFSCFVSEKKIFDNIFSKMGLKKKDGTYRRYELSYLMEVADDICYGLIDLQDAIELKIISLSEVKDIFILLAGEDDWNLINQKDVSDSSKIASLIGLSITSLTIHSSYIFKKNYKKIKSKHCESKDLLELFEDKKLKSGLEKAKDFASQRIFNNSKKIEVEIGAYVILETLLDNLIPAIYDLYINDKISHKSKSILALCSIQQDIKNDNLYKMYQIALDFIIGMTDNYSKYIAQKLNAVD